MRLNENVLECIDVVIYHMMMDGRAMMRKAIGNSRLAIIPVVAVGIVQTFRFGMVWMITWHFTNRLYRHRYTFVVQMGNGSCSGRLSGTDTKSCMLFRHGFLPCRIFLLVYLHGG